MNIHLKPKTFKFRGAFIAAMFALFITVNSNASVDSGSNGNHSLRAESSSILSLPHVDQEGVKRLIHIFDIDVKDEILFETLSDFTKNLKSSFTALKDVKKTGEAFINEMILNGMCLDYSQDDKTLKKDLFLQQVKSMIISKVYREYNKQLRDLMKTHTQSSGPLPFSRAQAPSSDNDLTVGGRYAGGHLAGEEKARGITERKRTVQESLDRDLQNHVLASAEKERQKEEKIQDMIAKRHAWRNSEEGKAIIAQEAIDAAEWERKFKEKKGQTELQRTMEEQRAAAKKAAPAQARTSVDEESTLNYHDDQTEDVYS